VSRIYSLSASNISVAGATTLAMLRPNTTTALQILRMWVSQSGTLTSNNYRVQVVTQAAALPTTFTSQTPIRLLPGDPASGIVGGTSVAAGTSGINAVTETAGVRTVLLEDAFNNIVGWKWFETPKEQIIIPASFASGFGLFFPAAPAVLTGWAFGIIYKELG
jgi:hypothetical protein